MYCKHCGREVGDDQRFCSYCGARQQEEGPDQVPPQPDETTATQTGNYHYDAPQPSGGAPTGGNALLTIFAILCAVVYGVRAIGRFFGAVGVLLGGYFYGATVLTHVLLPMIQSGAYVCLCLLLLAMALKSTRENREAYFLGVSCLSLATLAVLAIRVLMMVLIDGLVYGWHWNWGGFVTSVLGLAVTVGGLWVLMYLDGQRALVGKSADQLRQLGYDLSDAMKELRFTGGNQNTSGQEGARPQYQSASADYGAGAAWKRPVTEDRNFVLYVVLTIITCGIYGLVFLYSMIQDVNTVCDGDGEHTRGLLGLILLSLVTCGIYSFYWYYCLGNRLAKNAPRYGMSFQENGTTVLLWMVIGSLLCGLGTWVANYIIIKNCNQLCAAYNRTHWN